VASVIQIRSVTKTYSNSGGTAALTGINLDIRPGEVTLLMGPSGSGKTTLISIMGAILRPTSGHVRIAGIDIDKFGESQLPAVRRRHIGFIFQSFNLMPTLTVIENVELALELKGVRGEKARKIAAAQLLEDVGLSDKLQALPADLSGGQKQRVAIARALAGNPDIVLADEPTAALDSVSGRIIMEKLQSLARQGRAVLIVTHDNRILDYADRILKIEDGRILSDSNSREDVDVVLVPRKKRRTAEQEEADRAARGWAGRKLYRISFVVLALLSTAWITSELLGFNRFSAPVIGPPHTAIAQADAHPEPAVLPLMVSGAGEVEPGSEELKISASVPGRLTGLPVKEGQQLTAGQTIAILDSGDLAARVAQAQANIEMRQAELDRLLNGSSSFDRQAAATAVAEAKAILDNANSEVLQRKSLFESGDISRSDFDRSQQTAQLAQLRLDKATLNASSLNSPARLDETARAQASLRAAQQQLAESRMLLSKANIRAPFAGAVLKIYHHVGEAVSPSDAIVSFGDISDLVVRVDVDETDVAKIRLGQAAYVTAQAFGARRFPGVVSHIGGQLGRKNIESGDPQEKADTKVLETSVSLDGHPPLPIGLRVDAFIETPAAKGN
jgi:putative ABC transport system ATP-binding protein